MSAALARQLVYLFHLNSSIPAHAYLLSNEVSCWIVQERF